MQAAPQLRDLKKEATAFVPTAVKRKKASTSSSMKVNAAPDMVDEDSDLVPSRPDRPDLLHTLKERLGSSQRDIVDTKKRSDYDKFLEQMSDILGPDK